MKKVIFVLFLSVCSWATQAQSKDEVAVANAVEALKKAMIDAAETTYLVADSTKVGKSSFASLGALSLINYLITDNGIEDNHLQLFKQNDIEVIIAK